MRKFLLVVTLPLLFTGVFVSCDKNDDSNNGSLSNEKLISKISFKDINSSGNSYTKRLEYDENGNAIKGGTYEVDIYTYGDNQIKEQSVNDNYYHVYFLNKKGFIEEDAYNGKTTVLIYSYNDNNQLISVKGEKETFLTWENENVIKRKTTEKGLVEEATYTFSNYEDKSGLFRFLNGYGDFDCLPFNKYLGQKNKNLPEKEIITIISGSYNSEQTRTYEYEFDNDGYITSIHITENNSSGYYTQKQYTYTIEYK